MEKFLERTALLLGDCGIEKLENAKVAIFGIGGVGGHAAEAIARCGVKEIDLFDNDRVSESNINRQAVANYNTIGELKVDIMQKRIMEINPKSVVNCHPVFYLPDNADDFPLEKYDYIVDAVDTITAKLELIVRAKKVGVPIISSMGAGNKLDPTKFLVDDIYKTSVCPLAKVIRKECKNRGIDSLKVVYSKEEPIKPATTMVGENGKAVPGSISFVPSVVGLIIAGEVVKDIAGTNGN